MRPIFVNILYPVLHGMDGSSLIGISFARLRPAIAVSSFVEAGRQGGDGQDTAHSQMKKEVRNCGGGGSICQCGKYLYRAPVTKPGQVPGGSPHQIGGVR